MPEKPYSSGYQIGVHYRGKSTDEDFPRGQKIKSGFLFKLTIAIGLFAIICTVAIPGSKNQVKKEFQKIATASIDQINAGQLSRLLNNQNTENINQTEIIEKAITGKIIEWDLEILVVAKMSDHYKIVTKPTSDYPGTLLTLYPHDGRQITYMDNVQPGTRIKIKGKISGILQGRIKINPALLM